MKAQISGIESWQFREVSGGIYHGQNSLNLEFGLGDASIIDTLVVVWPASNKTQIYPNVAVNQFLIIYEDTTITGVTVKTNTPNSFILSQNYPNPFNPSTTIKYELSATNLVELTIYNILGRRIKRLVKTSQPAGSYQIKWNGKDELGADVSSGIYYYQLRSGKYLDTKKMLLQR
jgi:hypothetical protein